MAMASTAFLPSLPLPHGAALSSAARHSARGARRSPACAASQAGNRCGVAKRPARAHLAVMATAAALALTAVPDVAHAYGLQNGRLEKCKGDIPCISTSSVGNPSKFGPPWTYEPETSDPDVAWASLKAAVAESRDHGTIVESVDGPKEYYFRAEFPSSLKGVDDVEFRLIKSDSLVTYRSASREAIFLYPLQTPINTDKNRSRLLDIRRALGWEEFAGFNVFGLDQLQG